MMGWFKLALYLGDRGVVQQRRLLATVLLGISACRGEGANEAESGFTTGEVPSETTAGDTTGTGGEVDACAEIEGAVIDCTEVDEVAILADQPPTCGGAPISPVAVPGGVDGPLAWMGQWPGQVTETDPAIVGVWTTLVPNEIPFEESPDLHLPVHSIHRPTGKFLQFGAHNQDGDAYDYDTDKVVWYPPAPCSPWEDGIANCDNRFDSIVETEEIESHYHVNQEGGDPDMTEFNLFCAGHVNAPPLTTLEYLAPTTITVGGSYPADVNQGFPGAFMFREELPDVGLPGSEDAEWHQLDDLSSYRWYPGMTVLADARMSVTGGVFNNQGSVECTQDGAMMSTAEACACDPNDPGDFYTMLGICDEDTGFCDPDAEPNANPGFIPCVRTNEFVLGLDVGERTAANAIAWEEIGLGVNWGNYPHMFVLPDLPHFSEPGGTQLGGKLVMVGAESGLFAPGDQAALWDPSSPYSPIAYFGGPSCTRGSSSVMYANDRILKFGGTLSGADDGPQTSRLSEILDLSEPCPQWRRPEGGELALPRHYAAGVLLPDGNVITAGGGIGNRRVGDEDDLVTQEFDERSYSAFTTEFFDRDSETWCRLADLPGEDPELPHTYRGYHAQSFLLPDGRVYLGAGGNFTDTTTHYNYQLFAPPYLFRGPRPDLTPDGMETTVNDITSMVAGGDPVRFVRGNNVEIERVTLVKLSASTHQFDQEQRLVELEFDAETDPDWIDVVPPPSTCYATPGYYMLFAISAEDEENEEAPGGVPSIARYVAISGECEAAEVPAAAPAYPDGPPLGINDLAAHDADGLRASCSGEGSQLRVEDFGQSLLDLCSATRACLDTGSIDVEIRFVSSTGQANPDPDELIASATIEFAGGVPSFVSDGIELNVAGTEFNGSVDLGPGDHILSVCGTLGIMSACLEQPLRVEPVVAEDAEADYRAGAIEPGWIDTSLLSPGPGLALGDDDVLAVSLPQDFVFPYFDEDIDTIWVGANGGIRVTNGDVPATNLGLPASGGPQIAVYWDDLDPTVSGRVVTYARTDRFVVAWEDVAVASGGTISAQAHLFRDGRIELHYLSMADGPAAFGGSATIGVQFDGDALELSENSTALLSSDASFALDRTTCIASALRLPDSTPCADRVAAAPFEIAICAAEADVSLTVPDAPSICAKRTSSVIGGTVLLGDEPVAAEADGSVRLYPGTYTASWEMMERSYGAVPGSTYSPVGETTEQLITVFVTDDQAVCCREDQPVQTLTSGNDGPGYVCGAGTACCALALAGNDNLSSGSGADTLLGGEGSDTMYGGGGNDVVAGGPGDDWLSGGNHDDIVLGGDGTDHMTGDAGNDVVVGGLGNDEFSGKDGDDQLWGGLGDDEINEYSYNGNDTILPGAGADEVYAGSGNDSVIVLDVCEVVAGEILDGGSGTDTLWLPPGVDVTDVEAIGATVTGFESVQTLIGQPWGGSECAP